MAAGILGRRSPINPKHIPDIRGANLRNSPLWHRPFSRSSHLSLLCTVANGRRYLSGSHQNQKVNKQANPISFTPRHQNLASSDTIRVKSRFQWTWKKLFWAILSKGHCHEIVAICRFDFTGCNFVWMRRIGTKYAAVHGAHCLTR